MTFVVYAPFFHYAVTTRSLTRAKGDPADRCNQRPADNDSHTVTVYLETDWNRRLENTSSTFQTRLIVLIQLHLQSNQISEYTLGKKTS